MKQLSPAHVVLEATSEGNSLAASVTAVAEQYGATIVYAQPLDSRAVLQQLQQQGKLLAAEQSSPDLYVAANNGAQAVSDFLQQQTLSGRDPTSSVRVATGAAGLNGTSESTAGSANLLPGRTDPSSTTLCNSSNNQSSNGSNGSSHSSNGGSHSSSADGTQSSHDSFEPGFEANGVQAGVDAGEMPAWVTTWLNDQPPEMVSMVQQLLDSRRDDVWDVLKQVAVDAGTTGSNALSDASKRSSSDNSSTASGHAPQQADGTQAGNDNANANCNAVASSHDGQSSDGNGHMQLRDLPDITLRPR